MKLLLLLLLIIISFLNLNCMLTQYTMAGYRRNPQYNQHPNHFCFAFIKWSKQNHIRQKDASVSNRFCRWLYMPFIRIIVLVICMFMSLDDFNHTGFIDFFLYPAKYSRTVMIVQPDYILTELSGGDIQPFYPQSLCFIGGIYTEFI